MKRWILLSFFCLAQFSMEATKPTPFPPPPVPAQPAPKTRPPKPIKEKPVEEEIVVPTTVSFTIPGIIGLEGGQWKGLDHLLNLTNNIQISADILAGTDIAAPFTEEEIRTRVAAAFNKAGLKTGSAASSGGAPLPYINFVVMLQRCGDEYAAFIQARLFEKVKLDRVVLPDEVSFQAITWEDSNLIVMEQSQVKSEVLNQIGDMTDYFIARYNFFEKETMRMRGQ